MRRYTILLTTLSVLMLPAGVACTRLSGVDKPASEERVVTSIKVNTKSSSSQDDDARRSRVLTLDVLAFRQDGSLDVSARGEGDEITLEVTAGAELDFRIIANAPAGAFLGVTKRSGYESLASDLIDNAESFVMTGRARGSATGDDLMPVELTKLVSRVDIGGIEPVFLSTSFPGSSCSLKSVYLINVSGNCTYGRTPLAGPKWYNPMEMKRGDHEPMTSVSLDIPLKATETAVVNASLYCYPNPTDNNADYGTSPEWSERNTRVVLEVSVGGQVYYYPVTLPSMKCNTIYSISDIRLLGLGSSRPDELIVRNNIEFTIGVNPWEDNGQEDIMVK